MALKLTITVEAPASNVIQFPIARRKMQPTAAQQANARFIGDIVTQSRGK